MRDATLVWLLAYAGLRRGEALALEWRHIRERTISKRKWVECSDFRRALSRTRTADPLLTMAFLGQPVATHGNAFRHLGRLRDRSICDWLPPVATARLHKRSIP
jgi:hypothetical protein